MKLEINAWLSHTITVCGLILLVGVATYITNNSWCLLALVFIPKLEVESKTKTDS